MTRPLVPRNWQMTKELKRAHKKYLFVELRPKSFAKDATHWIRARHNSLDRRVRKKPITKTRRLKCK